MNAIETVKEWTKTEWAEAQKNQAESEKGTREYWYYSGVSDRLGKLHILLFDVLQLGRVPKTGIELIATERERQLSAEGWTPEHDDEHLLGEMATAAACYAEPMRSRPCGFHSRAGWVPLRWPWSFSWWKPTPNDRVRELVKAGALIAAEIDRLQRQDASLPSAERS